MLKLGSILDRAVRLIAPFRLYVTLAVFVLLLTFAAVQTVRIEGFKVWPVSIEGWKAKAERYEGDLKRVRLAQAAAAEKARLARLAQEAQYRALAERIDANAQRNLGRNTDAAERFIATGGYRCGVRAEANRGDGSRAGASAEGGSASNPEGASRATELDGAEVVGVTADDVRICTTNTIKAEAAKAWAEGVK